MTYGRSAWKFQWQCALVYVDDANVYLASFNKHLVDLQRIFDRLIMVGLKLKSAKCTFRMPKLLYLRYIISKMGFKPNPTKIQVIQTYPNPVHVEGV